MIMSRRNKQGGMAVYDRNYLVDGKMVMGETDKDGDGFFESVTVFNPVTDNFEMFTRQPDGSVKPISTQTLNVTKKQNAVVAETMNNLFQKTNMSDEELGDLLEKTRQKVQDLGKEKKDEKK
jgi:hypothetical protein